MLLAEAVCAAEQYLRGVSANALARPSSQSYPPPAACHEQSHAAAQGCRKSLLIPIRREQLLLAFQPLSRSKPTYTGVLHEDRNPQNAAGRGGIRDF